VSTLIRNLRYAIRTLARSPGFCAAAVVTLAVGIGANTAMFSLVHAMLVRPLPYPHKDRIVQIWATNAGNGWTRAPVSPLDFIDWRARSQSFERMAAARFWFYSLAASSTRNGRADPEQVHGMRVSPGFFEALGVTPPLGRTFLVEEEQPGRDRVVILTHAIWQRRFAADPALIGQTVSIDARPYTVVGILPRDFWFYPILGKPVELWMPFAFEPSELARDARSIIVFGLLKSGMPLERARAEMAAIAGRLEQAYPTENKGWGTRVDAGINSKEEITPKVLLLFGAVGLVLLVACANVANLTLARAVLRRREIALRSALGASRRALVGQLLAESAVIGVVGCLAGLGVGALCLWLLVKFWSPRFEAFLYGGLENLQLNGTVLAFSIAATVLSVLMVGLAPALQTSRPSLGDALTSGERVSGPAPGGRRIREALMVSQVAVALMLLIGAGLMISSVGTLQQIDRGLTTDGVLTAQMWPPEARYVQPHELTGFQRRVIDGLATIPGAISASAINFLPLSEMGIGSGFTIEGRPALTAEDRPHAQYCVVAPRYLQTMRIRLLKGRDLVDADSAEAPAVAVIDEKLSRRYWPGEDPIGKRFAFDARDSESPWQANLASGWITVVGIASTVRGDGLWEDGAPVVYLPYQQNPSRMMHLVVRAEDDPLGLARALRNTVWEVDPDQPLSFVRKMEDVPAWALAERHLTTQLLAVFAGLAILVAASGIYGVIAFTSSRQTRELAIRLTLGAETRQITRMMIVQGLRVAGMGILAGIAGALALTRLLASQLYGVTATDARTFALACTSLILVAVLACYLPARRASRVDPITALREE
jgi:putative ABC transport system permease protein